MGILLVLYAFISYKGFVCLHIILLSLKGLKSTMIWVFTVEIIFHWAMGTSGPLRLLLLLFWNNAQRLDQKKNLLRIYLLRHLSHPKIPLQGSGKPQDITVRSISFRVIPVGSARSAARAFQSGISVSLSTKVLLSLSRSNSYPLIPLERGERGPQRAIRHWDYHLQVCRNQFRLVLRCARVDFNKCAKTFLSTKKEITFSKTANDTM